MEQTQNILLNSSINKKSVNENASLNIALSGNRKLLPEGAISDTLNAYDIFLKEREKSNKFRIILTINPYCSNVLFNPFTEIVKNEGSPNVIVLNYQDEMTTSELNCLIDGKNGDTCENHIIGKTNDVTTNVENANYKITKEFKWNAKKKRVNESEFVNVPSNYEEIRDTQLSNETCGFDYHCGLDIFNNHILRSKTFKAVNYNETNSKTPIFSLYAAYGAGYSNVFVHDGTITTVTIPHVYIDENFNTIDDYMRDRNGYIVSEQFPKIATKAEYWDGRNRDIRRNATLPLHLYQDYDIYSFNDCYEEKLIEDNGWYGFSNPATINNIAIENTGGEENVYRELNINKTINNKRYCDFIDMYPGRDLYSFNPIYNKFRKRLEKNWEYCLTYPSENLITMEDEGKTEFPFFKIDSSGKTALKVYMFDEGTVDDDETALLTIYSVCQHGLKEGDFVNIYKSDDLFYDEVEVVHVIDKYTFQVYKDTSNMSNMWIEVEDRTVSNVDIENPYEILNDDGTKTTPTPQIIMGGVLMAGDKYYPICGSNRCNVDPDAQDITFRRVVNGVECEYYVRKFSRLPNFKFKDEEINDFTLYDDYHVKNGGVKRRFSDDKLPLIKRFSKPGDKTCEFENHISKLGFANTSYSDDVVEIVYTDDIDISYLKDNLGRPLSDIYFTIIKNNKGHKEWYGIGQEMTPGSANVEYSHCFGKNNSSFLLSDYYREQLDMPNVELMDVRDITFTNKKGLKFSGDTDEIVFDKFWDFYGDICCYSPVDCDEQSIQMSMSRFNTVQRELQTLNGSYSLPYFNNGTLVYDEIRDVEKNLIYLRDFPTGDPYDSFKTGTLQHTAKQKKENQMKLYEGYYHQMHYRIPLKTVSQSLSIDNGIKYEIVAIKKDVNTTNEDRVLFEFKTSLENNFLKNDKVVLYKRSTNEYYFITVYDIFSSYRFNCVINDEIGNSVDDIDGIIDIENIDDYVIIKKGENTPSYARLIKDGSCRYCWRNIISNGVENDSKIYPFTNGAFYVTQQINFFLRRQDPNFNKTEWHNGNVDYTPKGENINDYPNFVIDDKATYEVNEISESC